MCSLPSFLLAWPVPEVVPTSYAPLNHPTRLVLLSILVGRERERGKKRGEGGVAVAVVAMGREGGGRAAVVWCGEEEEEGRKERDKKRKEKIRKICNFSNPQMHKSFLTNFAVKYSKILYEHLKNRNNFGNHP